MKKLLVIFSLLAASFGVATANDEFNDGLLENMSIESFVSTLNDVEGYLFVGVGEQRDVSLILSRPDGTENDAYFQKWTWKSLNSSIARILNGTVDDVPTLEGVAYGETIIMGRDENGESHNYVVFVCPKITIVSPEGAIYSYHKVFNQNTRIQFTQSKDYSINTVMRISGDKKDDITDDITKDGWYESKDQITDDTIFWIAMESNETDDDSQTATGSEDVRVIVNGSAVTFIGTEDFMQADFEVYDLWDHMLFKGKWPTDDTPTIGTLYFNPGNQGIFRIKNLYNNKTYKIIIHNFES